MEDHHLTLPTLAAQLVARSRAVWPDPEFCPDVPPEPYLHAYLQNPHLLPADLRKQIRFSPNCQRVLEELRLENLLEDISPETDASQQPLEPPQLAEKPLLHLADLVPGAFYTVSPQAEHFDPDSCMEYRYRWVTPMVLLLRAPQVKPHNDTTVLVAAVSSAVLLDEDHFCPIDESEVVIPGYGPAVVHWWLEYEMSKDQLWGLLGRAEADVFEQLKLERAHALTTEDDLDLSEAAEDEREQLQEVTAWLSHTADARRARDEFLDQEAEEFLAADPGITSAAAAALPILELAGHRDLTSQLVLAYAVPPGAMREFYRQGTLSTIYHQDWATCVTPFAPLAGGRVQGKWELPLKFTAPAGSICFFMDGDNGKLLGNGFVRAQSGRLQAVLNKCLSSTLDVANLKILVTCLCPGS